MPLAVGAQVFLSGLPAEYAELEGAECEVFNVAATWVTVKLASSGRLIKLGSNKNLLSTPPAKPAGETEVIAVGQLPAGTRIVAQGLRQSPETNGQQALIDSWMQTEERYSVSFGRDMKDKSKGALLRPANVRLATDKDDRSLIGRYVKRPLAADRFLLGRVTRFHPGVGLFVRYEDGDREHLAAIDVVRHSFIPDDRETARLMGIMAKYPESPSDAEDVGVSTPIVDSLTKVDGGDGGDEGAGSCGGSEVRIFSDPLFYAHRGGGQDRDGLWLRAIREALLRAGLYGGEAAGPGQGQAAAAGASAATVQEVIRSGVHSAEYMHALARVASGISDQQPRLDLGKQSVMKLLGRALAICDGECIMDKSTMSAVLLRAGLTRDALFGILRGEVECGFVLARPACHHVPYLVREDDEEDKAPHSGGLESTAASGSTHHQHVKPSGLKPGDEVACGFCFVNAVAFSIREAQRVFSRPNLPLKVAILDVDVHHGNGNEHVFYEDPNVLHISLHRYGDTADGHRIMPASGHFEDCGAAEGRGFNVNFEMHLDDGDAEYCDAMRRVVFPVLEQFDADVLVLLCGFDALDHSGAAEKFKGPGMDCSLTPRWFWWLGDQVKQRFSRVLVSTEGGYDPRQAGLAGECLVRGLTGQKQPVYYDKLVEQPPQDPLWTSHVEERICFLKNLGWTRLE